MTTPIESAKTALAPFAEVAEDMAALPDDEVLCVRSSGLSDFTLTVGDFQAVSRALKDLEGSAQGGVRVEDEAYRYAVNLAGILREIHYPKNTDWRPLDDTLGVLTQIDNMVAGLVRPEPHQHGGVPGWKLVPVEPTPEMRAAAYPRILDDEGEGRAKDVYVSMLSASPPLPVHQVDAEAVAVVGEWVRGWRQCGCTDAGCAGRHEERNAVLDDVEETLVPLLGDVFAHPQPQETVDTLKRESARLTNALTKIDAIRNSIIGFQNVGWSEHIYPLVAALQEAGFEGQGYEEARENVSSLLAVTNAAETRATNAEARIASARARELEMAREKDDAEARIAELEKENGRFSEALTPSGDTKAAFIGEFFEEIDVPNPEYDPDDEDSDEGEYLHVRVPVQWTTVKAIMAAIAARALLAPDASKIEGAGR